MLKSFTVIDPTTSKYPDLRDIALTEEWAKGLMYCDMEGFALNEDGRLILLDECGNSRTCPHGRFIVQFNEDASCPDESALSFDELLAMDGQPVWVAGNNDYPGYWALVFVRNGNAVWLNDKYGNGEGMFRQTDLDQQGLLAYKVKPVERKSLSHDANMGSFVSDYSPGSRLTIVRNEDGGIILKIREKGEIASL